MFGISIIKTKDLEALKAEKEETKKALDEIMGKYENLHRLHKALWDKYQKEQQDADERINDLAQQLRKLEHERNKLKNKLQKKENK